MKLNQPFVTCIFSCDFKSTNKVEVIEICLYRISLYSWLRNKELYNKFIIIIIINIIMKREKIEPMEFFILLSSNGKLTATQFVPVFVLIISIDIVSTLYLSTYIVSTLY